MSQPISKVVQHLQPFESTELEWVRVGDIRYDYSYQRPIKLALVKKIMSSFDPLGFGVAPLSRRHDGQLYGMDAQQRCTAVWRKFGEEAIVPALVMTGLSVSQEADLWMKLNTKTNVTTLEKFRARVIAGDPIAVDIQQIIQNRGLAIGFSGPGKIQAVGSCEKIYTGYRTHLQTHHPDKLGTTLTLLVENFGMSKEALNGDLILGVGLILLTYKKRVDVTRLSGVLDRLPGIDNQKAVSLLTRAGVMAKASMGNKIDAIANLVVDAYNRGLRTNQLPAYRDMTNDGLK